MNTNTFQVIFWGTRGSSSASHSDFTTYGCNTSCVSVEVNGIQLIIDAGTGIKFLGDSSFIKDNKNINILLSHFHFDHIIGLPFFGKMFNKDAVINVHARPLVYDSLYDLMNSYFTPPFFPVEFMGKDSVATIKFNDLSQSGIIQFQDDVKVSYICVPHSLEATSYRIMSQNKSVCYMSDLELGASCVEFADYLLAFARNADLLILDTFFLGKYVISGWGHSSWAQAINFAKQARVKKIAMFHHNINSTDSMLDGCYKEYKDLFEDIVVARDGLELYV